MSVVHGGGTLMTTQTSLFSTRPVNSNERQTHDHEDEAQRGEARRLQTRDEGHCSICTRQRPEESGKPTWIFGLEVIGSSVLGTMRM